MGAEQLIETQILGWLRWKAIFAWKVKTTATYDPRIGAYRKCHPYYLKGVSDILGIYKGKPLAIEVKAPKGRVSVEQKLFQQQFIENGGLSFVVRNIEELELQLKIVDQSIHEKSGAV